MKRTLLALIAALLLALGLGTLLLKDGGYILIHFAGWELETSFIFAVLALIVIVSALAAIFFILKPVTHVVRPQFWDERRERRAHTTLLRTAVHALTKGEWQKANKNFAKAAGQGDWVLPAMLGAAVTSRELNATTEQQAWLEAAAQEKDGELPTLFVQGYLALTDNMPGKAVELLEPHGRKLRKNPWYLSMLGEAYFQDQQWYAYTNIAPRLKKINAGLHVEEREQYAWRERLRDAAKTITKDREDLARHVRAEWQHMPKELKSDGQLIAQYTGYLAQMGGGKDAFKLIREHMQTEWNEALLPVLAAIEEQQVPARKRIELMEIWLQDRPTNNALLLCLAQVASSEPDYALSVEEWLLMCRQEPLAWRGLAEHYAAQGQMDKATEALWKWHQSMGPSLNVSQQPVVLQQANHEARNQTHPNVEAEGHPPQQ
ncbi:MAG TPA: heme biosynthesis HemY N-terminal domain-containing protein [Alcanivoracaceae bacterium]|nr:heme biosynthesis HemY N-terminal domain-containing protein [Alcanivoracaceae bacterium]